MTPAGYCIGCGRRSLTDQCHACEAAEAERIAGEAIAGPPPTGSPGGLKMVQRGGEGAAAVSAASAVEASRVQWEDGVSARVVRVADVEAERVEWHWRGWLPAGKLVVVEGDPGEGKSTVALDLAARLSVGSPMPDGSSRPAAADVLLLSAEDGVADTIRPRLEAAGAKLMRIHVLTEVCEGGGSKPPELPEDTPLIERVVVDRAARLVVIDPLVAFLAGGVDSHRDQDVRRALHALAALAERTGCTVLAVRHLNKSAGARAIYRGGGSIGIIAAARLGLLVAPDPQDDGRHVIAVVKSNLAAKPEALAYRLVPDEQYDAARVSWEGAAGYTADDLLRPRSEEGHSAEDEAEGFLRAELADGPRPAKEIQAAAEEAGIAKRTLDRAKKTLGVVAAREGGVADKGCWIWSLRKSANRSEAAHAGALGALSGNGLDKSNLAADFPSPSPKDANPRFGALTATPPDRAPWPDPDEAEPERLDATVEDWRKERSPEPSEGDTAT